LGGEAPARGKTQAQANSGQGSQVPAWDRRRRLQEQAAEPAPVPGRRRKSPGHTSRPPSRNGASGVWNTPFRAYSRRLGATQRGGAVSKARGTADGDAAGPQESSGSEASPEQA